jgi:hypothetical protein
MPLRMSVLLFTRPQKYPLRGGKRQLSAFVDKY